MDTGFSFAGLSAQRGDRAADNAAGRLDWTALRARFAAGYAARRALLGECAQPRAEGSFAVAVARALADHADRFTRINLNDLADRKLHGATPAMTPQSTMTGDRG